MTPESNLQTLLSSMHPELDPTEYVFVSTNSLTPLQLQSTPLMEFQESEGRTLIIPRSEAETLKLKFEFLCKRITLRVHSSLSAVGFLAALCHRLAQAEIPVNAVSAFYHDHLFIPSVRADDALVILTNMMTAAKD